MASRIRRGRPDGPPSSRYVSWATIMAQVQQVAAQAVTVAVPPRTVRNAATQTAVAMSASAQTKPPPKLPARLAESG
eukprot:7812117-Alexandrium_andersonii.AAC.1